MSESSAATSVAEVRELAAAVRALPCPVCGGGDRPLDAVQLSWIESYWGYVCEQHWAILVGCERCLNRGAALTLRWTLRRGFWSLLGLLLAPLTIARRLLAGRVRVAAEPSPWLLAFVVRYGDEARRAVTRREAEPLLVGVDRVLRSALAGTAGGDG
jgi:hypothetical protein